MQAEARPRRPMRWTRRMRRSASRVFADELGGCVGGVVVDEDELKGEGVEGFFETFDELGDVCVLVVGRDHDREVNAML